MKKMNRKDGLDLYTFQNETYYRLPNIKPPKFVKVEL